MQMVSSEAKVIAAGAYHSMVLKQDGSIWATGSNEYGQFGDGSTASEDRFVRIYGAGHNRSYARDSLPLFACCFTI